MAVTDTAVLLADDRVEVYLGVVDEDARTARHDLHVFGDADLLDALAADLTAAAEALRLAVPAEAPEAPEAPEGGEKPASKKRGA